MSFCGTGNSLQVTLDSLDQLTELDETNNVAWIPYITVSCVGKYYHSKLGSDLSDDLSSFYFMARRGDTPDTLRQRVVFQE